MKQTAILLPAAAMVAVTAAVSIRLFLDRMGELRTKRIAPQAMATSRQAAEVLKKVNSADNFRNLFEVPVLFYALCIGLFAAKMATSLFLAGAWIYVALRVIHSIIHCTYNRVTHRFVVYLVSTLLLYAMWALFAFDLFAAN